MKKQEQKMEEKLDKKDLKVKNKNNPIVDALTIITIIVSLAYFLILIFKGEIELRLTNMISGILLVLFTIVYGTTLITNKKNNAKLIICSNLLLITFFTYGIVNTLNIIDFVNSNTVTNFSSKDLTYVMEWGTDNKIEVEQIYEYSDIVPEYHVISQNYKEGTALDKVKKLIVSISEGPNPYKEIIIPSMVTWNSEDVLDYIEENHLSNVKFEFKTDSAPENTVIEQNINGTIKRNDELKLTFSLGEKRDYEEVKLIDFTKMSKLRVEFYLKRHGLRYEFSEDFHESIKANYAISQEQKPGTVIKVDDEKVKVVISKGPKVKVPDLTKMSTKEITDWIIKNKLKLKFKDRYDDNVKENNIIEASFKKDEIIKQGTTVEIILSKGQLKMKKFDKLSDFLEWASKYNIKYEEQHEFSDTVPIGEIISYSYKKGDVIKNNDTIIIKISDGKKIEVPNLKGLTKKEISSKLDKLNLNYNFVYKSSNDVPEGKAISQSISSGSEVSSKTTITITISSGKPKNKPSGSNSGSSGNSNSGNSGGGNQPVTPSCDKSKGSNLIIQAGHSGAETITMIKSLNPNHKFSFSKVHACSNGDTAPGTVCNGAALFNAWKNYCDTISIQVVE